MCLWRVACTLGLYRMHPGGTKPTAAAAKAVVSIDVPFLVASCVELARGAAGIIRNVVQTGESLCAVDKAEQDAVATAATRDETTFSDPQTIADRRAQQYIVTSLRKSFGPGLKIVAEEGEMGAQPDTPDAVDLNVLDPLKVVSEPLFSECPRELRTIEPKRLCVFVDPLDGTKPFTRGEYRAVTTLLGITLDERPIGGVIGLPLLAEPAPLGITTTGSAASSSYAVNSSTAAIGSEEHIAKRRKTLFSSHELYGLHGVGTFGIHELQEKFNMDNNATSKQLAKPVKKLVNVEKTKFPSKAVVSSGRSSQDAIDTLRMMNIYPDKDIIFLNGAGSKFVEVLLGNADIYLYLRPHTSRWDIASGEALLRASGGTLTNSSGEPYRYPHLTFEDCNEKEMFVDVNHNKGGIIAANCELYHKWSVENYSVQHLARDPIGRVVTPSWFNQVFKKSKIGSAKRAIRCIVAISRCSSETKTIVMTALKLFERNNENHRVVLYKRFLGEPERRGLMLSNEKHIHQILKELVRQEFHPLPLLCTQTREQMKGLHPPRGALEISSVALLDLSGIKHPRITLRHSDNDATIVLSKLARFHRKTSECSRDKLKQLPAPKNLTHEAPSAPLLPKGAPAELNDVYNLVIEVTASFQRLLTLWNQHDQSTSDFASLAKAMQLGNVGPAFIVLAETESGSKDAFFLDYSAAGFGSGILDLPRYVWSSLTLEDIKQYEDKLVKTYFSGFLNVEKLDETQLSVCKKLYVAALGTVIADALDSSSKFADSTKFPISHLINQESCVYLRQKLTDFKLDETTIEMLSRPSSLTGTLLL